MTHAYNSLIEARQPFFNSKCCTNISNGCKICNPPTDSLLSSYSGYNRYAPAMCFKKILCKGDPDLGNNCNQGCDYCKNKGFTILTIIYDEYRFGVVKDTNQDYKDFCEEYNVKEELRNDNV